MKPAKLITTIKSFGKVRKDIYVEKERICDLVMVLIKILPKKTLNKKIIWKGERKTVYDILYYEIDP